MDERLATKIRELTELGTQERRTKDRLDLALQAFKGTCMDRDVLAMRAERDRVMALVEALLDQTSLCMSKRLELEDYVTRNGWR